MKKLLFLIFILPAIMLAGCSEGENVLDGNGELTGTDNLKEYIVSLGFSGEITGITESPLSKAASSDLYGIQVYSSPSTADDYKPYAYGLFDNVGDMVIKLLEGYKYKFVVTMIVDGKNALHSIENKYYSPFGTKTEINNGFLYSTIEYFEYLDYGAAYMKEPNALFSVPKVERFYGELDGYKPNENTSISIIMKRVCFGAKFVSEGMKEGRLDIQISEAPLISIIYPNNYVEGIFTFENNFRFGHLPYGNIWTSDDYSETIPVNITWQKNDGASIPLISRDITFKRNKLTTITIKVKDSSVDNRVDITTENEAIQPGENIFIDTSDPNESGVEIE